MESMENKEDKITFYEWLSESGLHDLEQIFMDYNMSTLISVSVDNDDFVSLLNDHRVSNQRELLQKIINAIKSFQMQQLIKDNQNKSQIIINQYKILRRLHAKLDQQRIDESLKFENNLQIITQLKQELKQKEDEIISQSMLVGQLMDQQFRFIKRNQTLQDRLRKIHNCNDKECVCQTLEIYKNREEYKIKMLWSLDRELVMESVEIAQIIIEYLVCGYITIQEKMCNIFVPDEIVFICVQYYKLEKWNLFNPFEPKFENVDKRWRKRVVFVHYQHIICNKTLNWNCTNLQNEEEREKLVLPIKYLSTTKISGTDKISYTQCYYFWEKLLEKNDKYVYGLYHYKDIFSLYLSYFENRCIKKWLIDHELVHLEQMFIDCKLNDILQLIRERDHKSKLIDQQRKTIKHLHLELDGGNNDKCSEIVRKLSDKLSEKEHSVKIQEDCMKISMNQYQKHNKMLVKKLKSIKKMQLSKAANLKTNVNPQSTNTAEAKESKATSKNITKMVEPEEIVKCLVFGYLKVQQKLHNLPIPKEIAQLCAVYYYNYDLKGWIVKKAPTFARGWQKRWIIVRGYNIFYSKNETDIKDTQNEAERKKFLNAIPLLIVQYIVGTDHSRSGRKFEIVVRDPRTGDRRHYEWKAVSREECDKWVHGLNECKKLLSLYLNYSQKS